MAEPMRFTCTNCHRRLKVPGSAGGRRVTCPTCGVKLTVPTSGIAAPVSVPHADSPVVCSMCLGASRSTDGLLIEGLCRECRSDSQAALNMVHRNPFTCDSCNGSNPLRIGEIFKTPLISGSVFCKECYPGAHGKSWRREPTYLPQPDPLPLPDSFEDSFTETASESRTFHRQPVTGAARKDWLWVTLGLVAVVALGIGVWAAVRSGKPQQVDTAVEPKPTPPAGPTLPYKLDADGVVVTQDCTLILTATAYIFEDEKGKFIHTPAVSLIPVGKSVASHHFRHPDAEGNGPFTPKVRLIVENIPLKPSLGLQTDDGRFILGEDNSIGSDVTTKLIKKGTRIIPAQPIVVSDTAGKIIATHRPPEGARTSAAPKPAPVPVSPKTANPADLIVGSWSGAYPTLKTNGDSETLDDVWVFEKAGTFRRVITIFPGTTATQEGTYRVLNENSLEITNGNTILVWKMTLTADSLVIAHPTNPQPGAVGEGTSTLQRTNDSAKAVVPKVILEEPKSEPIEGKPDLDLSDAVFERLAKSKRKIIPFYAKAAGGKLEVKNGKDVGWSTEVAGWISPIGWAWSSRYLDLGDGTVCVNIGPHPVTVSGMSIKKGECVVLRKGKLVKAALADLENEEGR